MSPLDDLPIREDLRGQKPYGAPQLSVPVSLNVNENTHGIPEAVALAIVEKLAQATIGLNRYPDREFLELRQQLATFLGHNLAAENIWAANGSNEILQQLFNAFGGPGRRALSFSPTYSMYPNIARTTLTAYVEKPRNPDYTLSSDLIVSAIREEKPGLVILCSPNNPTGTPLSLDCVAAAYEATDGIVIVDEAYAEFSDRDSALTLLAGRPRLVVSRTMSKAFAFAGARLGYLAADSAAVDALRIVRLPYHLSALTQAAASAALEHSELLLQNVQKIKQQRDRIIEAAKQWGLTPYPSDANFVLVGGFKDSNKTFEQLLAAGVLVRNVGIPNTLRITAGTEAETTKLLAELALVLE
ncbi:MAG: histidinol-phosphate transaminase [Aquiluna sp.]